jgi:hypothetical protein
MSLLLNLRSTTPSPRVSVVTTFNGGIEVNNVTNHTFTVPTGQGIVAGDVLVVNVSLASSTTVTNATLGNEVSGSPWAASGRGQHVWVYTLTSADIGTTFILVSGTTIKVATTCVVLRGLDPVTPISIAPVNTNSASTTLTPTFPAGSPGVNKVVLHLLALFNATANPPTTYSTPSGITFRGSVATGGATGRANSAIGTDLKDNDTPGTTWNIDVANSYSVTTLTLNAIATQVNVYQTKLATPSTTKVNVYRTGLVEEKAGTRLSMV